MIDVFPDPPDLLTPSNVRSIGERIAAIAARIEDSERVKFGDVSVAIVDTKRIRSLHEEFFDDPSPTDVITFPGPDGNQSSILDGDVAICLEVAEDQASEDGHSTEDELVFLAVHGLLHLCGWTDADPMDRARMLAHQRQLMGQPNES